MNFKKLMMIATIAMPSLLFAQKEIIINETQKNMSAGNQNCYVTLLPQTNIKNVSDGWKKYIRKDTKAKPDDNNGETKIIGANSKNISTAPLNIYATFLETSDGIQVSVWVAEGDAFISTQSNSDKSIGVQNYIHNFGVQEYKRAVQDQIVVEQGKQGDMEGIYDGYVKDQKKSENNIKGYNKDIEKLQSKITDEQKNIQAAQANQASARANADSQKMKVQQINDMMNNIK